MSGNTTPTLRLGMHTLPVFTGGQKMPVYMARQYGLCILPVFTETPTN